MKTAESGLLYLFYVLYVHCNEIPVGFTVKSLETGCQWFYHYFLRAYVELLQELSRRMG